METIDVDGVTISYSMVGSGPVLLLTHGFSASSHMFAANAVELSDRYTVVTWDMRGHGSSDSPESQSAYSAALAVGDMLAILDHVGAAKAVIGGHSLGGFLSLSFYAAHPQRVSALLLIDTGPGYRNDGARDGWNDMAERFADNFERHGLEALQQSDELSAAVHRHGAGGLAKAARGILTQHDSTVIDLLPSIVVPTLVIVGSQDTPFIAGSEYMASKIPGASLSVIDGAGHAPNVSHPDEFNAIAHAFLSGIAHPLGG